MSEQQRADFFRALMAEAVARAGQAAPAGDPDDPDDPDDEGDDEDAAGEPATQG
ncbi:hypothetical protein [Micromonospora sp. NPDC047187]|uniref:hypothetical protein n=1 Tax=Micromonospora sp. NPDC047187 TaxID=3155262 RepID=UPI0033DEE42B